MITPEEKIQQQYYASTAESYDETHVHSDDEHYEALTYISDFIDRLKIDSMLDVGCGTGRALGYFSQKHPDLTLKGIEPVQALLDQAVQRNNIPAEMLDCGSGTTLPYAAGSFDATCAFGVLHHVQDPNVVVKEMLRVAKKAVFISDMNRFGMGRGRLIKLLLSKSGAFKAVYRIKTGGKGYVINENDGLFYSYSVFDSFNVLARSSSQIIQIPTKTNTLRSWFHPLLTSSHILMCAIKK